MPLIEAVFDVELDAGTRLAMYFVGSLGFGIAMAKAVEVPAQRLRDRWFPSRSPGIAIFPPDEFVARRAKVIEQIGDGVAIVLGTTEPLGELPFRQNCQFFYLTGVTVPRASVIIDGRAKTTTVFLQPRTERQDTSQYGPGMNPGAAAAKALGVKAAVDCVRVHLGDQGAGFRRANHLYAVRRGGAGQPEPGDPTRLWENNAKDPWTDATRAKRRSSPG